ncbi:MAG: tRNA 2-thiouridine(34) synthase MnmA [Firmicutes bacterium]|nr:tRNA 2-thiouridine(34) synthase MnmA [Bacillota bacterium]
MNVLIGLSGGLDSTYAAYRLKNEGHSVTGASVVMHDYTDTGAAEKAAQEVGIPFVKIDMRGTFEKEVIDPFCRAYINAYTPNPCVMCNPAVKFAALYDYAQKHNFDRIATGHYARIGCENGRFFISTADDDSRDQSYVLWGLSQEQLSMLFFPLSSMKKTDIRADAERLGLSAAEAKESREICFIPSNNYAEYIEKRMNTSFPPGDFIDDSGKKVGEHKGIIHYTIGQRKGLGLAMNGHVFVTDIDPVSNTVTVSRAGNEYSDRAMLCGLRFQKLAPANETYRAEVKIRYAARPVPAEVTIQNDSAEVLFTEPVRAVTPGQSAVFYDGGDLLFGGIITKNK